MYADVSEVLQLADDITRNAGQVDRQAHLVVKKTGYDTVAAIQQGIRDADAINTGTSLNSTSVDFTDEGLGFEAGPTTEYFVFVDQGTSEITPRNILAPAADRSFEGLIEAFGAIGDRAVSRG